MARIQYPLTLALLIGIGRLLAPYATAADPAIAV